MLNLSIGVASTALIGFCAPKEVLYLDTCIEPWDSLCTDPRVPLARRANYALREDVLTMKHRLGKDSPTALVTQGANPGLSSALTKKSDYEASVNRPLSHPPLTESVQADDTSVEGLDWGQPIEDRRVGGKPAVLRGRL